MSVSLSRRRLSCFRILVPVLAVTSVVFAGPVATPQAGGPAPARSPDSLFRLADESAGWRLRLTPSGAISALSLRTADGWKDIAFRADEYAGPAWIVRGETEAERALPRPSKGGDRVANDKPPARVALAADPLNPGRFFGRRNGIEFTLEYGTTGGALSVTAEVRNAGTQVFSPIGAGLRLGVDTGMKSYPQWDGVLFPTLLRCEKTHFWGYFMGPTGTILGVSSPDPVASWTNEYNAVGMHRIFTSSLYFINESPLPARHPQNLASLRPGESLRRTVFFSLIANPGGIKPTLAKLARAPMVDASGAYTVTPGESAPVRVFSESPVTIRVIGPDGRVETPGTVGKPGGCEFSLKASSGFGEYRVEVTGAEGRVSEALFYCRKPWSWYLRQARRGDIAAPPLAAPYAEWWYGFYTTFLAKRFVPDAGEDAVTEKTFRELLPGIFDQETGVALRPHPIQKNGSMIGVLTAAYRANGDIRDLDMAARIADRQVARHQGADGAYRANGTGPHYTAVIYPAKSMLELALVERELSAKDALWKERSERHFASARAAVYDLKKHLDDIGTEGENTFEDGMISCSALQLARYALACDDAGERAEFTRAARYMLMKHRCLEQTELPDCRMNGGTLRFWEGVYDLRLSPNMMNSPHGWSSWKTYATHYLYLLTGEEHWLRETMDAVGSAMQVVDVESGGLRWGFVPDPYVRAYARAEDPQRPGVETYINKIIGEQYVAMNRNWFAKQASDNTVHEHFAMLAEVALTHAFVLMRADGSLLAYNCTVAPEGGTLVVTPDESLVDAVHLNLSAGAVVRVKFDGRERVENIPAGMHWVKR